MCIEGCKQPPDPCPPCKSGEICIQTSYTCAACAANVCVSAGGSGSGGHKGGGNSATIGGAVGGVFAALAVVAVVGVWYIRRRQRELRRQAYLAEEQRQREKQREKRRTKRDTQAFVQNVARANNSGGPGSTNEKGLSPRTPKSSNPFLGGELPNSSQVSLTSSLAVNDAHSGSSPAAVTRPGKGHPVMSGESLVDPFGDHNSVHPSVGEAGSGRERSGTSGSRDSDAYTFRSSQSTSIIPIAYIPAHSSSLAIEDAEERGPYGESRNTEREGREKPDLRLSLPQSLRSSVRDSGVSGAGDMSPSVVAGLALEKLNLPTPPPSASRSSMHSPLVGPGGKPIRPPRAPGLDLKLPEGEARSPGSASSPSVATDSRPLSGFPWSTASPTASTTAPTVKAGSHFSSSTVGQPSMLFSGTPSQLQIPSHPGNHASTNSSLVNAYGNLSPTSPNGNRDSEELRDQLGRPDTAMSHLSTISSVSSVNTDGHLSYILDAPQIVTRQQITIAARPMVGTAGQLVRKASTGTSGARSNSGFTVSPLQTPKAEDTPKNPFTDDNVPLPPAPLERKGSASRHLPKESFGLPSDRALFTLGDEPDHHRGQGSRPGTAESGMPRRSVDTMRTGTSMSSRRESLNTQHAGQASSDPNSPGWLTSEAGQLQRQQDAAQHSRASVNSVASANDSIWTSTTGGPGRESYQSDSTTRGRGDASPFDDRHSVSVDGKDRGVSMASSSGGDSDLGMLDDVPFAGQQNGHLASAWPTPPVRTPTTPNAQLSTPGLEVLPPSAATPTFSATGIAPPDQRASLAAPPRGPNRDSGMSDASYGSDMPQSRVTSQAISVLDGIPFQLGFPGMDRASVGSNMSEAFSTAGGGPSGVQTARQSTMSDWEAEEMASPPPLPNGAHPGQPFAPDSYPPAVAPAPTPPKPSATPPPLQPGAAGMSFYGHAAASAVRQVSPLYHMAVPASAGAPVSAPTSASRPSLEQNNAPRPLPAPTPQAPAKSVVGNSSAANAKPTDRSSIDTLELSAELAARFEGMM